MPVSRAGCWPCRGHDGRVEDPEDVIDGGREPRRWPPGRIRLVVVVLAASVLAIVVLVLVRVGGSHRDRSATASSTSTSSSSRVPSATGSPTPLRTVRANYADVCDGGTGCPSGSVPLALRRPLFPMSSTAAGRCPTTVARPVEPGLGAAAGAGPVFAVTGGPHHHAGVPIQLPPDPSSGFAGTGVGGAKIIWLVAPAYHGPVLIRGFQIHGNHPMLFSPYTGPGTSELQLPPTPGRAHGWHDTIDYVRLHAQGCYAWQVDGTSFSYTIVFDATRTDD